MIKLRPVTHKYAYCGPACLQMVMEYLGVRKTQKKIGEVAGTTHVTGTPHKGMIQAVESYGFHAKVKHTKATFDDLHAWVNKKNLPVIVNWYSVFNPPASGHYSVVVAIDKKNITLMDPEIRATRVLTLDEFNKLWFDFDEDLEFRNPPLRTVFRWMLVAVPKKNNFSRKTQDK